MVEVIYELVEDNLTNLEPDEDMLPLLVHENSCGEKILTAIGMPMDTHEQKDRMAAVLIANMAIDGAVQGVFVSMAWMVTGDSDEDLPSGSLADHPDRVEVVSAFHATPDGDAIHNAVLTRHDGKPPTIENGWTVTDVGEMSGGRIALALRTGLFLGKNMPEGLREVLDNTERTKGINALASVLLRKMHDPDE